MHSHVVIYVVIGVVVVASKSSTSAYIRVLIQRTDQGVPNVPYDSISCWTKWILWIHNYVITHGVINPEDALSPLLPEQGSVPHTATKPSKH